MIQPEDIRRKAENLYPKFLRAWLAGDKTFFPRVIPGNKKPAADLADAIHAVRTLREGAKERLGYGYTVEWRQINSRRYGRNQFPDRITFETQDDYLRFIGKRREFGRFAAAVEEIRRRYPALEDWLGSNPSTLLAIEPELPQLLEVLDAFSERPRPGCFARELSISSDSKFIERHQPLLRQWLDRVLPADAIRADETHFERRYGLRYAEPHLFVRFLDPAIQWEAGFPCEVVSVPLHTLEGWHLERINVLIVENKVNLLTAPPLDRTLGLGALGKAVSLLRYLPWLAQAPITYWGDLDVEGLTILSDLRALYPHTQSLFMDRQSLDAWRHLAVEGTRQTPDVPAHLTPGEADAYRVCREHNLRIEQERIPQAAVHEALSHVGADHKPGRNGKQRL